MKDTAQNEGIGDLEERIAILEKKLEELEGRVLKLEQLESGSVKKEESKQVTAKETKESPLSIRLLKKGFHKATWIDEDVEDLIEFEFEFTNHLKKGIRAFTGIVIFKDLFERKIMEVGLIVEGLNVKPGKTFKWKGGIVYNQFMVEHRRLREIPKEDLLVDFDLEQVIYTDGTRESFI